MSIHLFWGVIAVDPKEQIVTLKTWLRRYGDAQRDLGHLYDRIDALRSRAESTRTSTIDGLPHSGGYGIDKTGAMLAQIEELEAEAMELQGQAVVVRHEIEAAVKQITGPRYPDQRAVLRCRYLDSMTWTDIAELLFGNLEKFWISSDTYVRRCHRLHSEALVALAEIVDLSGDTGKASKTNNKMQFPVPTYRDRKLKGEKMEIFEKLEQLTDDYRTTKLALTAARREAADITGAVRERLAAERAQSENRRAELEAQATDESRTETVRRLAADESARLKAFTPTVTATEAEAFEIAMVSADQAVSDLRKIRQDTKDALDAAVAELEQIRTSVFGDETPNLAQRWLEGDRKTFVNLCKEGRSNETEPRP